tara:strand:- start:127 stop:474 length:348 start_codon:yes stop_codon:yes gene_type:complete
MKITEEQLKKCVAEYEAGDSMAVLAKRYEVSLTTLRNYICDKTTIRSQGPIAGTPGLRKERGPEWDDLGKVPDAELAERVGCSRQNVARVREVLGIPSARDLEIFARMSKANKDD